MRSKSQFLFTVGLIIVLAIIWYVRERQKQDVEPTNNGANSEVNQDVRSDRNLQIDKDMQIDWKPKGGSAIDAQSGETKILTAFKNRKSDVMVEGEAVVHKNLNDDTVGDKHQKMILKLASGHTILLAHNIDLAPRVPADEGDKIEFKGEYEYSEQGGVLHWTHDDPGKRHADGWIRHDGRTYK